MNKTFINNAMRVDPKTLTETTRFVRKGAPPSSPPIAPGPVTPEKRHTTPTRTYTAKEAQEAIHRIHHAYCEKAIKSVQALHENASEAQIQAVRETINRRATELKQELGGILTTVIETERALHGDEQAEPPQASERTSTTKGRGRKLETESEMSSSRSSMISSLNLPAPMLESQLGEASSSIGHSRRDRACATWAPPTPPNASPEHQAARRAKFDRRMEGDEVGSEKGEESDGKEYWRQAMFRASAASKERPNPREANKKKRSGNEDDHSPFTDGYPRKNRV